jgi:hypothetical protein
MSEQSNQKEIKIEVEVGEFKKSPVISFHELDDKGERKPYPFTIGIKKAKIILANLKAVEEFVKQ